MNGFCWLLGLLTFGGGLIALIVHIAGKNARTEAELQQVKADEQRAKDDLKIEADRADTGLDALERMRGKRKLPPA